MSTVATTAKPVGAAARTAPNASRPGQEPSGPPGAFARALAEASADAVRGLPADSAQREPGRAGRRSKERADAGASAAARRLGEQIPAPTPVTAFPSSVARSGAAADASEGAPPGRGLRLGLASTAPLPSPAVRDAASPRTLKTGVASGAGEPLVPGRAGEQAARQVSPAGTARASDPVPEARLPEMPRAERSQADGPIGRPQVVEPQVERPSPASVRSEIQAGRGTQQDGQATPGKVTETTRPADASPAAASARRPAYGEPVQCAETPAQTQAQTQAPVSAARAPMRAMAAARAAEQAIERLGASVEASRPGGAGEGQGGAPAQGQPVSQLFGASGLAAPAPGSTAPPGGPAGASAAEAAASVRSMAAGLLDQLDTAALRQAARETRVHVDLGELGTVDVRVRSAAALDAGRLHVTVEAARADTAALLRGGIGGLCEALEARGYADPTVDVEGPDTRPGGGSEEQAHGESRWEQAEDAEALAAAIGRRVRDRASGAAGARREQA